ncbi:MAG: hypothetical protein LV481_16585 [Methylacidiphilales bacterium]|nr:hypothetical protein [Candidatus Methylacidiphilales bacterium]
MDQPDVAVANPVHPAAEFAHGLHLDDQMPVITHQAIAPKINLKLGRGLAYDLEENGIFFRLPKKHLSMIATIEDMKPPSIQMGPWKPWHTSLLSPTRLTLKSRCVPRTVRVPVPFFRIMLVNNFINWRWIYPTIYGVEEIIKKRDFTIVCTYKTIFLSNGETTRESK